MIDIRSRLDKIQEVLRLGSNAKHFYFLYESIFLQYRIIIETIMLSNLVTHQKQYTKGYKKLRKLWRPHEILQFIESINPNFYPVPVSVDPIAGAIEGTFSINNIKSGFFTKQEIVDAYNLCSKYIHAKHPFSDNRNLDIIREVFSNWWHSISLLLNVHLIQLYDIDKQFLATCYMTTESPMYMLYLKRG
jgi:hypothetical protein